MISSSVLTAVGVVLLVFLSSGEVVGGLGGNEEFVVTSCGGELKDRLVATEQFSRCLTGDGNDGGCGGSGCSVRCFDKEEGSSSSSVLLEVGECGDVFVGGDPLSSSSSSFERVGVTQLWVESRRGEDNNDDVLFRICSTSAVTAELSECDVSFVVRQNKKGGSSDCCDGAGGGGGGGRSRVRRNSVGRKKTDLEDLHTGGDSASTSQSSVVGSSCDVSSVFDCGAGMACVAQNITTSSGQKSSGVCDCLGGYESGDGGVTCVKGSTHPQPEHHSTNSTGVAVGSAFGWLFFVLLLCGVIGGAYYYEKRTNGGLSSRLSFFGIHRRGGRRRSRLEENVSNNNNSRNNRVVVVDDDEDFDDEDDDEPLLL